MLVVFGLWNLQRAQQRGISAWTSLIVVSLACAAVFPLLALMGGTVPALSLLWQPAVVGGLFLAGQLMTFLAVHRGDVSIAAPVMGVKVLLVPVAVSLLVGDELPARVWVAAAIAVVGIGFVQVRDQSVDRSRIVASVLFALLAACAMTAFDLLIQRWAREWGAGFFLPIAFACGALLSLLFTPLADKPSRVSEVGATRPLLIGAALMSVQAIGMTVTLGLFGDATRVNIVYSLRGLWGVLLTWALSRHAVSTTSTPGNRTMAMRLIGALLIGISVVISVT